MCLGRRLRIYLFALALAVVNAAQSDPANTTDETRFDQRINLLGMAPAQRTLAWNRLIRTGRALPHREKLNLLNDLFNQIPYIPDIEHWGQTDYWATPIELLGSNGGDCEDYSIAKYFTLRAMGVPTNQLYLTYALAKTAAGKDQVHIVLNYYAAPTEEPLVLDNITPEILNSSQRADLAPIFSFNTAGQWLATKYPRKPQPFKTRQFERWTNLIGRLASQQNDI